MKRLMFLAAVVLVLTLPACQCAWPPPIGPVEGEEESVAAQRPAAPSPEALRLG